MRLLNSLPLITKVFLTMSDGMMTPATILLADDEDCLRNLTHIVLEEQGYCVLAAANATEALLLAKQHDGHIDLLLTDMRMPDMDGAQLAVEFRKSFPLSRVIFMTAYLLSDVQNQLPGEIILSKPFSIDVLCDSIRRMLNP